MNNKAETEQDEAMEWITDWDYERILPTDRDPSSPIGTPDRAQLRKGLANHHKQNELEGEDDNDSMVMMEIDADQHVHSLPLEAAKASHPADLDDPNNKEISIFWTRVVHEDITDDDEIGDMFGMSSPQNSRTSLNLMMEDDKDHPAETSTSKSDISDRKTNDGMQQQNEKDYLSYQHARSDMNIPVENSSPMDATPDAEDEDDDVDSIMSPLEDKEGLLPPISPSQLYDQSNAQYGIIQSPHPDSTHLQDLALVVKPNPSASASAGSVATNTTMDMMDDEVATIASQESSSIISSCQNSSINNNGSGKSSTAPLQHLPHPYAAHPHHPYHRQHHHYYNPHYPHPPPLHPGYPSTMIKRQQQLLQEVLQEAPQRKQSRRSSYELPKPTDEHQRMIEEMRSRPNNKKTKIQGRSLAARRPNKNGQKLIEQRPDSSNAADSGVFCKYEIEPSSSEQVPKYKAEDDTCDSKTQTSADSQMKTSTNGGVSIELKGKNINFSQAMSSKSTSASSTTKSKAPAPHGHPYAHHHSHHHPPHHPGNHYPPYPHHHPHHHPHVPPPPHHLHQHPRPHHPHTHHHGVTTSNAAGAGHHLHHLLPQPSSSPVSVTKTLTRAGMDSDEYQKVVARLTEKNLMERQRVLLQESMKRSLETRQALHIRPTALPDYNHDKLSKVLKDIESSSRSISETYGRR